MPNVRRDMIAALAVGAVYLVAGGLGISSLWAQRSSNEVDAGDVPLDEDDIPAIERSLRSRAGVRLARVELGRAADEAARTATCRIREEGVDPARRALRAGNSRRGLERARAFAEAATGESCSDADGADGNSQPPRDDELDEEVARARLQEAVALLELARPAEALDSLEAVEPDATPIPDYVGWLRARAHAELGDDSTAADLYGRVFLHEETPLKYRARARQAHALVDAGRADEALPVIRRLLRLFPDYPRRFRLVFDRARAFELLGRYSEAAEAYQTAWYEFPHKSTGDRALARLEALADRGVEPTPLRPRELFDRYRELRIHKHWELAERLLRRLRERVASDGRRPKLANEIEMQLALNAFVPKRNREALEHFRHLRDEWEAGRRAGIQIDVVDDYLSRTLARLGRFDDALEAERRALSRRRASTRKRELIEFYRRHSRYERAFELADALYSEASKKRWPYLWLLYKTGRLERAAEGFEAYADSRTGRRAAKGRYWRARLHERTDQPERARDLYAAVADKHSAGYYGIQAVNRLRDLKHRAPVDQLFSGQTGSVLDSGDEIFAAFERAGSRANRAELPAPDPKKVPRRADPETGSLGAGGVAQADCLGGTESQRAFCRLLTGDLPEDTLELIGRAVVPFRGESPVRKKSNLGASEAGRTEAEAGDESEEESADEETSRSEVRHRVDYAKPARIHWSGRGQSERDFERWERGEVVGPVPTRPDAYGDRNHAGGIDRAAREAGDLFPALRRTRWLFDIGLFGEARNAVRDAALEYRGIVQRYRPPAGTPHELPYRRWTYHIDHRRYGEGFWGYEGDEIKRYPVPETPAEKRELADRQREIWDRRDSIRPHLVDAMKEAGDYHLVREFTQEQGGWYNREPTGSARSLWQQAYPRAFPRHVLRESREHGVNPYLIWALMTVESAHNPDSISTAEAIGLLQVIPRTGIKVAEWVGDDDFGPYDLVDEEVAIQQGVQYFSSLVRKFRGQELLAMAGYNGGPHRVATWLERKSPMPLDEFVEEVPFRQARLYVKKVTRYLALYLRLYEGRTSLYVGQELNRNPRPDPNF